ncbi:hypothetical protein QTO34_014385 [Cnephaeus nilssonii]|uniref:Uncharacterized protein n=1 Tax=Cnephaeus nilssonii TaxID=3371016 RepID=A0AA40LRU2_CNENI|nr:hypothetical protein QTO34_014385 [Eptesicus nilssonii]
MASCVQEVTITVLHREATLQEHVETLSGMTSPSCLTTAAAKSPRRHLHSLKPRINYLDSMLCCVMQFYQKKLHKSSHDVILSKKMRNISGRINPYRNRNLVTDTDIKKYGTNKNAKKESLFGNKGSHVNILPKWKPEAISVASCSHISSH